MDSKSYEGLKNRINQIINNFSFEVKPTENPTPQQQDMALAMIVLCHAEFEEYFENMARDLLDRGVEQWDESNVANKNLASLFLEHEKIDKKVSIDQKARQAIADYRKKITSNHGIKTSNLKKLYKPLGYNVDDFDQAFISELESFGGQRGKVAHSSKESLKMENLPNVNDEIQKIERILKEIKVFQDEL